MSEIKRILAAIAFSKYSEGILNYASRLANDLDAELVVANVINVRDVQAVGRIEAMGYRVDVDEYVKGVKEERAASLEKMLETISFPIERVRSICKVGHPAEKLLQVIEEEAVDLVVMGAKGRSDLPHVLLGSVAEKMFRHSPVPVLSYRS
ncbi:MAG: universal stress protein [Proteobacteria bacterium]|nr:universal stress protein [Pseudomonadota bacterium]